MYFAPLTGLLRAFVLNCIAQTAKSSEIDAQSHNERKMLRIRLTQVRLKRRWSQITTEEKMIRRLRAQFLLGFNEGWSMYWSPFAALAREARKVWVAHVHRLNDKSGSV